MGKITKKATPKHDASLSPAISDLIISLCTIPLAEVPKALATLSYKWPYPRGDLYNWINPLNRFDDILNDFNSRYGLNTSVQNKPFGLTLILEGTPGADEKSLRELGFGPEGDRELIEAILNFHKLLLEKCGNRTIYNSGDGVNALLNTTSLSLLHCTLRLAFCLAQRYRERLRNYPQPFTTAESMYRLDLEKLHKLCSPISQDMLSAPNAGSISPTKTTKTRDKPSQPTRIRRGSSVVNPNDFRSLCRDTLVKTGSSKTASNLQATDTEWQQWVNVRMTFQPSQDNQNIERQIDLPNGSSQPSTPTPMRRQSTTSASRLSRMSTSEELNTKIPPGSTSEEAKLAQAGKVEISTPELFKTSIDTALAKHLGEVPQTSRYELLHKLRVAYGLMTSSVTRRRLLAIRLLAYASLAYVHPEGTLSLKLFGQDQDPLKRQQLIQQLVNLLHDGEKGRSNIPLEIQTLSLEVLSAMSKQKMASSEIVSVLGVNNNHGLLLLLTQKAVTDLNRDDDSTDNQEGDEWRDTLFSMLKNCLEATSHYARPSDTFATGDLISCYANALEKYTSKALRVQGRIVEFFKIFSHHVKDGLGVLSNNKAFDALCDLLGHLTQVALKLQHASQGIPTAHRTPITDYQIPYVHQQVIRTVIDLFNDISGHQGTHADRVVRALIDSPALLGALRLIVDNGEAFGPHTWSEAVKSVCGFLHYEPTSYAVIAEAGLVRSILRAITLDDSIAQAPSRTSDQAETSAIQLSEAHADADADADVMDGSGDPVQAPRPSKTISSWPESLPQGIAPTKDTIATIAQSFSAICLTTGGLNAFMSSGVLQKFFEIFESPAHVKALKAGNLLNILGSNFDELVRHHPELRAAVVSATIVMIARIKHICQSLTYTYGAGPKMWLDSGNGLRVSGGNQSLLIDISPGPRIDSSDQVLNPMTLNLPDGTILACTPIANRSPLGADAIPQNVDSDGLTALDYMTPALGFLAALFENQSICTSFMDGGGTDLVLDLATVPSMPDDHEFGPDGTSNELASITHMMTETKAHVVLPSLLQRALYACRQAEHFALNQPHDMSCYFDALIRQSSTSMDQMEIDNSEADYVIQNGTKIVKSLVALYHLVQLVSEVFEPPIYSARSSHGQPFGQVNLADVYSELCDALGRLAAACIRESIALQRNIPDSWFAATRPKWFPGANEDISSILGLRNPHQGNEPTSTEATTVNGESEPNIPEDGTQSRPRTTDVEKDENTAAYRNLHFLRRLLVELPSTITTFFRSLGRGLAGKRRIDTYQKQNASKVAGSIAAALKEQLSPSFLTAANESDRFDGHFAYLAVALHELNSSLFDLGSSPDQQCNITVLNAFKAINGLAILVNIGTDFFNQLKRCELAQETIQQTTAANSGLKTCLQIIGSLTSSKCIIDSPQSTSLKSQDPTRPFYFVPAQLLLELRLGALPLIRLIWDSDYADQASIAVVERLISVLKHILNGEQEHEAYRHPSNRPTLQTHPLRKVAIDTQKLAALTALGFDEDLAQEGLFRCHGSQVSAEEYCKALTIHPARQRCLVPEIQMETTRPRADDDEVATDVPPAMEIGDGPGRDHVDATVADLLSAITGGEVEESLAEETNERPTSSAMSINSLLNQVVDSTRENGDRPAMSDSHTAPVSTKGADEAVTEEVPCVETMNNKRDSIREELPERCVNLLNNHHGIIFELAELILSGSKKLSEEAAKVYRENATSMLINTLLSLQEDEEITESAGKKIAASAHLTALLLQDKAMFESAESLLREVFESLILFVKMAPSDSPGKEESSPWIGPVLLILERMLSRDAEPDKIEWRFPTDLESTGPAHFAPAMVFGPEQKAQLFAALIEILPRIGKDKSLALSVSRVLVILTRDRHLACLLAQKRNIQKLFVMVKQLVTGTNDRLQSALMLILRHVIEDEDTLRQVMKSEIIASFGNRSASRQVDTSTFIRELHHLALRSPKIFVEVANETVKLQRYEIRERAQILVLKPTGADHETVQKLSETGISTSSVTNAQLDSKPADSVETQEDTLAHSDKGKAAEGRALVVERPDGVIHFLLSELLSYKDVEDRSATGPMVAVEETAGPASSPLGNASGDANVGVYPTEQDSTNWINAKLEKSTLKAEDNPIYVYRCFLLQCLTELLLSYNRTKIEFINFSRKADPLASTPSKPRSGVLNYLLTALVPGSVEMEDSVACKKKTNTSTLAMKVIVALCSKTFEIPTSSLGSEDQEDEPNLTFVRRFVLEHAIKAFKDASTSTEPCETRYSRLLGLADLFHRLLAKAAATDGAPVQAAAQNSSFKVLGRMMFEKNLISVLTSSLADIELTLPGAKRVIKYILKPLNELTDMASHLSLTSSTPISSALGSAEEDISSASSVSDMQDEREETPDLFRNSALGIMEPHHQDETSSESNDDEDEEMYEEEYVDEMDYDNGAGGGGPDDGEVVSDDELDEQIRGSGHMEGLPGDVPMDLELVMNGGHGMDVDTEDEEEDGDEDDDDGDEDEDDDTEDDEDEDDGDEFDIEGDDVDMGGEINADNENDSLGDGPDGEEDWEDEGDGDEEIEFHDGDGGMPEFRGADHGDDDGERAIGGPQQALNNLLQAYNENPDDAAGNMATHFDAILGAGADQDPPDDEEDEDDDDEVDDMGENEDMAFETFNDMLGGQDDIVDQHDQWPWGEPSLPRRHRHIRASAHMPSFLTRHGRAGTEIAQFLGGPHRRHAVPARPGGDDGTNPLLQRASRSTDAIRITSMPHMPPPAGLEAQFSDHPPFGNTFSRAFIGGDGETTLNVHGEMLDAVMEALQRGGEVDLLRPGRFQISIDAPGPDVPRILRAGMPPSRLMRDEAYRMMSRDNLDRALSSEARSTANRWQEEARLLFGNGYLEIVLRVQKALLSVLVPPAQDEEKIRVKKHEEELEEAERKRAEAERLRKEEEEREAVAKAEAEREAAAAAAAAAVEAEAEARAAEVARISKGDQQDDAEPMEDVQSAETAQPVETSADAPLTQTTDEGTAAPPRVFTTIRGRQLDITNMAIDAEYLEALPEELREEVIMQQYAEQREQAQAEGGDANAIDPDFLDALPEDIREEIRQQEAHARRRRDRDAARRQAATITGPAQAEEMDNDNFLATLDPALRRAILAEQPAEILQQLDPRHAAEGRAHARHLFGFRGMPIGRDPRDDLGMRETAPKDNKRQVVQMIDRSGVATLLRLMFLPHQGSLRQNLFNVLRSVCGHRQTRLEVISLLLTILKEGSTDVTAVERSLANLSLRAKATSSQKTPQPLKRTLSMQPSTGISDEMTPTMVVQQCLAALGSLSRHDAHVKSIFLREVDVSAPAKPKSKKGKGKENKTTKYPLNELISLLDRKLIMENSICLQSFSELLAAVTSPLGFLMRKENTAHAKTDRNEGGGDTVAPNEVLDATVPRDEAMTEAPGEDTDLSQPEAQPSVETPPAAENPASHEGAEKPEGSGKVENTEDESKSKKAFDPPVIPDHNLELVVGILVAQECGRETFNMTLEAIRHLSYIPGTNTVFGAELSSQAKTLSQTILGDLDELLPLIRESQSGTDLQGIASSKFTPTSSDQSKLLRILTALDHISASKRREAQDGSDNDESTLKAVLNTSYESLSLGPLWSKLSDCLATIREKENIFSFATILLPLIESLMVVCKNTSLKDGPLARQAREQSVTSPRPEQLTGLEELFFTFTTEHRKILNEIIRQNPKLMSGSGSFALLVKNPKVLEFDNKRSYFTKQIHSRHRELHRPQPPLQLSVRRDNVFLDSFKSLYFKSPEEMKYGKLNIRFHGEEGVDAGGVTREWFQVLARGMFNPNYALWEPVASDKTTFHPSKLSGVNSEHLMFFKFIGRIIGKALHEGRVLDCHFSRAVYKKMLGKEPSLKDLESNDQDYYKSLTWILENDITDQFDAEFSVINDAFGVEEVIDLIENGRNIEVTEANKHEYVQKLVEYRLTGSVKDQLENFLRGFYDIIPAELVAIFNEQELELLISGLPEIDVDDWKANTEYHNYTASSPQIQWFWRMVRGMSQEERAKLLQFITGTSKVPLNGFKELEGIHGTTKTSLHRAPQKESLPTSHTCFNQLDLPTYDSYEELKRKTIIAITIGGEGFGFA